MPKERGLYPSMRVGEQIAYFGRISELGTRDAAAAAGRWMGRLGLAGWEEDRVDRLSHGNQQRVQLAVAPVHDPDLLVLDEPFAGLDPIAVDALRSAVPARQSRPEAGLAGRLRSGPLLSDLTRRGPWVPHIVLQSGLQLRGGRGSPVSTAVRAVGLA